MSYIESIVVVEYELKLSSEIACSSTEDAEENGGGRAHKTGGGRNGHKTADGSGAETNNRPLALKAVVHQHPGKATRASSEVGNDAGLDSTEVRAESAAAVESEPAEPDQNGTEVDESGVVRFAVVWLTNTLALAKHEGICQTCPAGSNVDGSTASIVKLRQVEKPSVRVPGPGGNWAVDDGSPAEGKDQTGQDATALKRTSDQDLDGDSAEEQLVKAEDDLGDVCVARRWRCRDIPETEVGHVADEGRGRP